ncbi:MAG: zf-HC2 domain-containing protein [Lachnospiraceae bacterium]|nr:zf-HC2 domain-containing protein [Lachnospiraceae bacterium]
MTCLEAQSKIIAYIDYNLDKEQKKEFLRHIQCCENCREELDIYYTMIEGMRQLDSNQSLSEDFSVKLSNRMEHEMKQSRKKRSLLRSSVLLLVVATFSAVMIGYVNFLDMLHQDEQAKLKEAQGQYYYSRTFKELMFEPEEIEYTINVESTEKESTFYEKVRQYNAVN